MTDLYMIRRTYNRYGDYDHLIRMEGNCPTWTSPAQFALVMNRTEAQATLDLIATYRDHCCPDGIKGCSIVPIPVAAKIKVTA